MLEHFFTLKSEIYSTIYTGKLMGLSGCSAFVVVVLVVLFVKSESFAENYISWDDMKVDEHEAGLNTRYEYKGRRIIVVDKNGWGDSHTVQGAVDMVPEHNTERVKIYIHPGIYR